jgi:TonB family protein
MKKQNDKPHKEKRFLTLPSYPGGKKAFIKFIEDSMVYPVQALENRIEGTVYIDYTVDNIGNVSDEIIVHGIGYGCDEEALRLVRMLRYDPKKNRGVRMKTKMKTRIRFELPLHLKPSPSVNYNYTTNKEVQSDKNTPTPSYSYSILINPGEK